MPTTGISQGGILMSQTNTMAMGGAQITQNVVPSNQQQNLATSAGPQGQMNLQVNYLFSCSKLVTRSHLCLTTITCSLM